MKVFLGFILGLTIGATIASYTASVRLSQNVATHDGSNLCSNSVTNETDTSVRAALPRQAGQTLESQDLDEGLNSLSDHSLEKPFSSVCPETPQTDSHFLLDELFDLAISESDKHRFEEIVGRIKKLLFTRYPIQSDGAVYDQEWEGFFDRLITLIPSDFEVHWYLAQAWLERDSHRARYHALIAATDTRFGRRAERMLRRLDFPEEGVTIPLIKQNGHYSIEAAIAGHSVSLLIDTGASITSISEFYLQQNPGIGKPNQREITLNTAGGSYLSYLFTASELSVGNLAFINHPVAVVNLPIESSFDGVLGLDILGQYEFQLSREDSLLTLNLPSDSP